MRKCKACGLQFYTTDPSKELCHCCEEALKRLNGYAVPVVRCKDCKHCTPSENILGGYGDCNRFERDNDNSIVCEDDFCSYGERKDNERKAD